MSDKVRCNNYKECSREHCGHKTPHSKELFCGKGPCRTVGKEVQCEDVFLSELFEGIDKDISEL